MLRSVAVLLWLACCLIARQESLAAGDGPEVKAGLTVRNAVGQPDRPHVSARALMISANACMIDKKWEEAIEVYKKVLKADSENDRATFGWGTALIELKRYKEALKILEPLLAKCPDDAALKNNIAWICVSSTDPAVRNVEKATKLARQAILDKPGDQDVWSTLAETHYAAGRYELALRASRIAVQLAQEQSPSRVWAFWDIFRRCSRAVDAEKGKAPVQ